MATLKELLSQKAALEKQIEQTTNDERASAIAMVRSLMADHGLTAADLGGRVPTKTKSGTVSKVAAKYRNASTGDSWSGRGLQPRWLKAALASGQKLSDFAV